MFRFFYNAFKTLVGRRYLIYTMARREVAANYVGSLLGFVWTFIHPIVLICVFWVVFSLGFRVKPMKDVPFVVWLTAGMAAWFAFSEMVAGAAGSVVANGNLVKRTLFPSQVLPVVKIFSSLANHLAFMLVLFVLIVLQHMPFSFFYFQALYYLGCMMVLAFGLGWMFSALNVFIRDVGQIVGVALQLGFWATPIFWDARMMPAALQQYLKLNPLYYIVQGYRDSFIYFVPFWQRPYITLYFWAVALTTLLVGATVFKRLQPQFSDAL
jgi:lipopolysaccharide transport system permease protein/teichoic acid transport system permease protein